MPKVLISDPMDPNAAAIFRANGVEVDERPGLSKDELEALALASEKVQRFLDGAQVRKVIVVPDRLVNIVT